MPPTAAGADRVLYTSHQAASPDSFFPPARDHAAVEAYLDQQGRPYTSLRNGYYTSSLMFHIGDAVQTGELVTPADGRVSWTARADLAAAAAAILTGEGTFDGPTPALTATETVAMEQVAAVLSEVSGRPVRRIVVADDEFLARLAQRGMPEPFARRFLGTYEAMRRGEFALTDPTLGALLDREPQSVRSALSVALTRQAVDAWSRASD